MPYRQRVPHRVPDVEVDDGYYESPAMNRGSLFLFFILLLLVGWVLFNRSEGFSSIGAGWGGQAVDWTTSEQPVAVEKPLVTRPLPIEQPRSRRPDIALEVPRARVAPAPVPKRQSVTSAPTPVTQPSERKGKFGKPTIGYRRELNVIGYAWITADGVNLRRGPGTDYDVLYLLPENWPVAVLVEADIDEQGEAWTRVRVDTPQGTKEGWLNRRFLSY